MAWLILAIIFFVGCIYLNKSVNNEPSKKSDSENAKKLDDPSSKILSYWEKYCKENPEKAKDIECLLKVSMSCLSDNDVKEKIYSIDRLSKGVNCPISNMKNLYKAELSNYPIDLIPDMLEDLQKDIQNEALLFNINVNNTISFIFKKWLQEYKRENFMRTGVIMTIKSSLCHISIKNENNEIEDIPIIFNIKEVFINEKKIEPLIIESDNGFNINEIINVEDNTITYWYLTVVDKDFDENKLKLYSTGQINYKKNLIPIISLKEVKYWNKNYGLVSIQEDSLESFKESMQSALAFDNYINTSNIIETIKHTDNMMNIFKKGTISF